MFAFPFSSSHPFLFPYQIRNYWLDMTISTLETLKASKSSLPLYPLSILPLLEPQASSYSLPPLSVSIDVLLKQSEQLKDNFWPFEITNTEAPAKPASAKPASAKPASAKPASAKPAAAKPASKPAAAKKTEPVSKTPVAKKTNVKAEKPVTTQLPLIEEAQPTIKKAKGKTGENTVATKKTRKPAARSTAKAEELPAQNLTQIRGIGPVVAKKLADKGITRFAQIAAWTAKDIDKFENEVMMGKLNGRIERDNWVIQAQFLEANC